MTDEPRFAFIRAFTSIHEAQLAKSVLEAAGIETMLADEHVVSITMYSNAVGGVKLLVPEDRLAEAESLLDSAAEVINGSPIDEAGNGTPD